MYNSICSNDGLFMREDKAMASRTRNRVASALNSLCNDGVSGIYDTSHDEFEALIGKYFNDDESNVESECGKECTKIFALLFTDVNSNRF